MIVTCEFCGFQIDTGRHAHSVKVTGWVKTKQGKPGTTITRASAPMGYACQTCLESRDGRGDAGLATLF